MIEQSEEITRKPVKPVKRAKKKAKPRAAKPVAAPSEFAGLTAGECANACYDKGACCITGGVCAHPSKCGLQSAFSGNSAVVAKFERAKKHIAHQKIG